MGEKFVNLALSNTDDRVRQGKTVSPSFLFAALLWHQVLEKWEAYKAAGEFPIPALHQAADDVLMAQTDALAIQRRIASDMRDIWALQPRFEKRAGKAPYKLLEHQRLRAGYDFLLLRCESGELDPALGAWWTDFMHGDNAEREHLIQQKQRLPSHASGAAEGKSGPVRKRKPRKRGPRRSGTETS